MTTFPHFSRLPLELRREIWIYVLPLPTIIEPKVGNRRPWSKYVKRYLSAVKAPPVLLQICRESRLFALSRYSFAFQHSYVDFAADIVYFHEPDDWKPWPISNFQSYDNAIDPAVTVQIQHLAIDMALWHENYDAYERNSGFENFPVSIVLEFLQEYTELRTLTLVIRADNCSRYRTCGEFVEESDLGHEPEGVMSMYDHLKKHLYHRWGKKSDKELCKDWDDTFNSELMPEERMLELLEAEKKHAMELVEQAKVEFPQATFPDLEWRFVKHDGRDDGVVQMPQI